MPPPTGRSRSRLSSLVTRDINEEKVNYGLQLPDLSPTQAFVDRLVDETLAAEQEIMVEFELHSQEHMRMVRGENGKCQARLLIGNRTGGTTVLYRTAVLLARGYATGGSGQYRVR